MRTLRWSAISLVVVGGCDLYLGDGSHAPSPPSGGDMPPDASDAPPADAPPADAGNGPEDSPVLPPPGAACTSPLPATSYVPPQTCGLDGYAFPTIINTDHMRAALVALWLKCAGSPFATSDEVGLEFTEDSHWYKLYLDGVGGLARGHGFGHEGTYELLYEYDHVQLNVAISGGGFIYLFPDFTTDPVKVRLNNMGYVGDYIRDDDTGACLPAP